MSGSRISNEDLEKVLRESEETARRDPKARWISRMMQSAKQYHKLCPYYDKRTTKCFLLLGGKCNRDGRFDGCPVFMDWLSQKYDELKSKGRQLPMDFLDLTLAV